MQNHSSVCVQSVGRIIEQKRILSLSGIDIVPAETNALGEIDPIKSICVTIRFKAAGAFSKGSPLIVTEHFPDDSQAMKYVLKIFDLLMESGLAARSNVVAWRRGLMVLV